MQISKHNPSTDLTEDTTGLSLELSSLVTDSKKLINLGNPSPRLHPSVPVRISHRKHLTTNEQYIPEESLESSSSVVLEDSQDFIILSSKKLYGSTDSFSQLHGINLKKIRSARFSEHSSHKDPQLQKDDDVQPEIASFHESAIKSERRARAESCYVKAQSVPPVKILALITQESFESADVSDSEFREEDCGKGNRFNEICERMRLFGTKDSEIMEDIDVGASENEFRDEEREESYRISEDGINDKASSDVCRYDESNSLSNGLTDRSGDIEALQSMKSSNGISVSFQCRSIDSIPDINGKVFTYFNKSLLCQIPVLSFTQILDKFKSLELSAKYSPVQTSSKFVNKVLCCMRNVIQEQDQGQLEQLMKFSKSKFDYSDEFHLELLLAAYCSITGETDWPSDGKEWMDMGFTSEDLAVELEGEGALGLFYMLFLASFFPKFLKEMLDVSRYFSYEVFKVCKFFAVDTIEIVKKGILNSMFSKEGGTLEAIFLFYTGMVMEWFKKMIKNKDFNETYQEVVINARKYPYKLICAAKKEMTQ